MAELGGIDFGRATRRSSAKSHANGKKNEAKESAREASPTPQQDLNDKEVARMLRRAANYLDPREAPPEEPHEPPPPPPPPPPAPVPSDKRLAFLNEHFSGHGAAILKAAQAKGIPVYEGLGMLSKESPGGLNIFERGVPPAQWDGKQVTRELVQAMITRPGYREGTASMWGVGMTQLTFYTYVLEAERLGGAHIPLNQLLVGFGILADNFRDLNRRQAFAAYNAGRGGMERGLGFDYADGAIRFADEWHRKLQALGVREPAPANPSKPEPEPKPAWIRMEAKPAWSKGGGWYVEQYPTHYNVRPEVKKLVEKYLNLPAFKGKVSACTYHLHPPANPHETLSVDFWDWRGRGFSINDDLQRQLFDVILKDPAPPRIHWAISDGRMWTDGVGWGPSPDGPPGSDPEHNHHIHCTFWPIEDD